MKKIVQLVAIIVSINSTMVYCWEWPWVDQEKRTNDFADKFEQEVIKRSASDFFVENNKKIAGLRDRIQDVSSIPQLSILFNYEKQSELARRMKVQKIMRESGFEIVSHNMNSLQEGPLNGLEGITGEQERKELRKILDENITHFKNEIDNEYGAGTIDHYWYQMFGILVQRREKEDSERKKSTTWTLFSPVEKPIIQPTQPSWLQKFKAWFNQKMEIPKTYTFPTFNRTMIKQRVSGIYVPKAFVPSEKTLERAQKLNRSYDMAPSSASKALEQQKRFGIGYE